MKIPQLRRRRWLPAIAVAAGLVLAGCAGTGGSGGDEASSGVGDVPTDTTATVRELMENVPDTDIVKISDELMQEWNRLAVRADGDDIPPFVLRILGTAP